MSDHGWYICFVSVFRSGADCISHFSPDGKKTLCGRSTKNAASFEELEEVPDGPDCLVCRRKMKGKK